MNAKIQFNEEVGVEGFYKLEVIRPDGSIRTTAEFPNLITNQGLDCFAVAPNNNTVNGIQYILNHCEVGTGNATPAFTDTGCQTPLAMFPASNGTNVESYAKTNVAGPPAYWKYVWTFTYGTGAAAGNIAEIVVGGTLNTDTHVRAFSRALILDGSGNPTTLTILSDEILRVTYELRMYYLTTDSTYSMDISGVTYTGTLRRLNVNSIPSVGNCFKQGGGSIFVCSGPIGAVTGTGAGGDLGTSSTSGSATMANYVSGNHYLDLTGNFDVNNGNGTIAAMRVSGNHGEWQYSLSPSLVKNNTQTLQVGFRFSWSRYTP